MKGKTFNRALAVLLAIVMVFGILPISAFAGEHDGQVHVVVENTVYAEAPWTGTLVDTWVSLNDDSTMMSCVVAALESVGATQEGAENDYIMSINGLSAGGVNGLDGWMGSINDWFTNEGFGAFAAAAGKLQAYDEIRIMYSLDMGEDIGGSFNNNDKTLSAVSFSAGTLNTAFDKDTHSYTLTVPAGTTSVKVTPTASNKNFQVRASVSGTEYKRTQDVPVSDGSVITLKCGDPAWPSMNGGNYGEADSVPAETYTFTVAMAEGNDAPTLAQGVETTATARVLPGSAYEIDLSSIFTDANGDELTYTVKIGDAGEVSADKNYSYTQNAEGVYTLEFKASDGVADSPAYTVTLTVRNEYVLNVNANGIAKITITGAEVKSAAVNGTTYDVVLKNGVQSGAQLNVEFAVSGDAKLSKDSVAAPPNQAGMRYAAITSVTDYTATIAEGTATLSTYCYNGYTACINGSADRTTQTLNFTVAEQTAPALKENISAKASAAIELGQGYNVDLSSLFEDADGDELNYKVSINSAPAVDADKNYVFTPNTGGKYTLVFTANDGTDDSTDTYTLTLSCYAVLSSDVTLSMQEKNGYLLIPQTVSVSSGLAESYGYEDSVYDAVSALDVLVKAEELKYKTAFRKDTAQNYLAVSGGSVTKINGVNTSNFGYTINRAFPYDPNSEYGAYGYMGYNIAQAAVANGSSVDFLAYQDSMYMDYYTWFEQSGAYTGELTVKEYESFSVDLIGYVHMFGSYTKEDMIKMGSYGAVEDAQLAVVDAETGALSDISGITTNENGKATLSFASSGTYYVSAYTVYADTYTYIMSPWLKVVVEDDLSGANSLTIRTSSSTANMSNALLAGEPNDYGVGIFNRQTLSYDLGSVYDTTTQLRFWYTLPEAKTAVDLTWNTGSKELTKATNTNVNISNTWANCLSGGKNTLNLTLTPPESSENHAVTYTFMVSSIPTLTSLSAKDGDTNLYLDKTFAATTDEYAITLMKTVKTISFAATPRDSGYSVTYNGSSSNVVNIENTDKVDIVVTAGSAENAVSNTYTVTLNKVDALNFVPVPTPSDALVVVYDQNGSPISKKDDGSFDGMFSSEDYTYTVTKYGYVAAGGIVPKNGGRLEINLAKASDDGLKDVNSVWKNFRNSDVNMGITNALTPTVKEETSLLWATKLGSGWGKAPSVQIIVDDSIVVMSNTNLYKLDMETGETIATGTMSAAPNFGYMPPTYAEGMIFCPLANGTVQAFNAQTLESLWIYNDPLKGQSLSPITYSDGYIYTGFWNGEAKAANFVCLSVTDEDPSKTNEAKTASWKYLQQGGFYWAGSLVYGDYVVVGTDDGASGYENTSYLHSFNKHTGELISTVALEGAGDQRSSIAYDSATNRVYFTTKGGYLYSAVVDIQTGAISGLKGVDYNAQATSTPVVHNGKVYFATGSGISSTGSSGNFVVADADSLQMLYAVGLLGYPQGSLLLSTAYEEDGYLYFYSTYNAKPGGISMIKVKNDATTAEDALLTELFDATGYAEYCITSIICGDDGTLYYKNDSCNVMAVGVPKYTTVIKLIDAIGTVTKDSANPIKAARDSYEALNDEDQTKVTNYQTLLDAEAAFNRIKSDEVIALIDSIGEVSLSSESTIDEAVNAYNALNDAQKALVNNYSTLTSAQSKLSELKAAECDRLIAAIGEVSLESESAITAARTYYTALTNDEKSLVENLSILEAAEAKLQELKDAQAKAPAGTTTSVTVTIDNVTYEISEATNAVINAINGLSRNDENKELSGEEANAVLNAYKAYSMLSEDEKLFVANYGQLEAQMKLLAESYHYDEKTGIDARDNDEKILPWYVKLNIKPVNVTEEQTAKIREVLGEAANFLALYDISLTDALTGKSYHPDGNITIKIPKPDDADYDTYVIVHMRDNGTYEYLEGRVEGEYIIFSASDFSNYGIAGFEGTWNEIVPTSSGKRDLTWLWITGMAVGVVAVGAALIIRRRHTLLEDDAEEE